MNIDARSGSGSSWCGAHRWNCLRMMSCNGIDSIVCILVLLKQYGLHSGIACGLDPVDFQWWGNIYWEWGSLSYRMEKVWVCPAPPFQPSIHSLETKLTLPALAAIALLQTWLKGHGWISCTALMPLMWFRWHSFILLCLCCQGATIKTPSNKWNREHNRILHGVETCIAPLDNGAFNGTWFVAPNHHREMKLPHRPIRFFMLQLMDRCTHKKFTTLVTTLVTPFAWSTICPTIRPLDKRLLLMTISRFYVLVLHKSYSAIRVLVQLRK